MPGPICLVICIPCDIVYNEPVNVLPEFCKMLLQMNQTQSRGLENPQVEVSLSEVQGPDLTAGV